MVSDVETWTESPTDWPMPSHRSHQRRLGTGGAQKLGRNAVKRQWTPTEFASDFGCFGLFFSIAPFRLGFNRIVRGGKAALCV